MALLATAYDRPGEAVVLAKLRRACERWTEGDKALAHIHLAHAGLPPCDEMHALRLFAADDLIEAGVTPETLMKAQGFGPAPLALLNPHLNPDQPCVSAGSGRESGEWSGGAGIDTAGVKEWIARLALEAARRAARSLRPPKTKPPNPEVLKPETKPRETPAPEQGISTPKPSDFVGQDFGTLGTAVEKPAIDIGEITGHAGDRITEYGQSFDDVQSIVSDPLIVLEQSDGRYYYLSDNGAVVWIDKAGS